MKILCLKLKSTFNFSSSSSVLTIIFMGEQDQEYFENFPQALIHIELLPFINQGVNKLSFVIDPTQLRIPYVESISFDFDFLVEHSETSDNRQCMSSDTTIENPYYNYDTTRTEQIETLHDPQVTFHDAHQIANEL